MKKTILFIIVLLALAFQVEAEQVFVHEKTGEVMVVPDGYNPATPIQLQVRSDPGAKAPIFEMIVDRPDFFHVVEKHVSNEVLVFQDGKFEKIPEHSEITGEPQFLWHIPIIFYLILLMFISNFGKVKGKDVTTAFAATIFAFATIAATTTFAATIFAFATIAATFNSKLLYWAFSIVLYILATLALFV